jgi:hypothetical protein
MKSEITLTHLAKSEMSLTPFALPFALLATEWGRKRSALEGDGMIPEQIYLTGLGRLAYFGLYVPMSLVFAWVTYRWVLRRLGNKWLRWVTMALFATTVVTAPLWDVYAIGVEAKRLCREQAGLHVYRTVEADGLLGWGLGKRETEHGFKFAESGGGDKMSRYTIQDGKVIHQRVNDFVSRYQYRTGDNHLVIGKHFERSSDQVIDRQTKEVLGELVVLSIFPGWFDNLAIALTGTGSGFSPWRCGEEPPPGRKAALGLYDLVFATIRPHKSIEGDQK